jgi:hypothetical protein
LRAIAISIATSTASVGARRSPHNDGVDAPLLAAVKIRA